LAARVFVSGASLAKPAPSLTCTPKRTQGTIGQRVCMRHSHGHMGRIGVAVAEGEARWEVRFGPPLRGGGLAVPPEVWGPRQAPRAPTWSTSRSAAQVSEDTGPFIYSDWPRTSGVMRPSFHAERALGPSGHKRARGPSQARRWERTVCKSDQPSATWAMTWLHRPPAAPRTSDAGGRRRPIVKQIFSPQISRTGPCASTFLMNFGRPLGRL
jgi:hypothetical protein